MLRPEREFRTIVSGNDMEMEVKNDLARGLAVVRVYVYALRAYGLKNGRRDEAYRAHRVRERLVIGIKNIFDALLGNDERVPGHVRTGIEESDGMFVLIDDFRRDLATNDLIEYGVFHGEGSIQ